MMRAVISHCSSCAVSANINYVGDGYHSNIITTNNYSTRAPAVMAGGPGGVEALYRNFGVLADAGEKAGEVRTLPYLLCVMGSYELYLSDLMLYTSH